MRIITFNSHSTPRLCACALLPRLLTPIMYWRFRLKQTFRTAVLLSFACAAVAACPNLAQAQKLDLAFGVSTVTAPSASSASGSYAPGSLTGRTYPAFHGDLPFFHPPRIVS